MSTLCNVLFEAVNFAEFVFCSMILYVFYDFRFYKDPGGPAQLGTRDWACLEGHGADRDLARYGGQKRAAPGEGNYY